MFIEGNSNLFGYTDALSSSLCVAAHIGKVILKVR